MSENPSLTIESTDQLFKLIAKLADDLTKTFGLSPQGAAPDWLLSLYGDKAPKMAQRAFSLLDDVQYGSVECNLPDFDFEKLDEQKSKDYFDLILRFHFEPAFKLTAFPGLENDAEILECRKIYNFIFEQATAERIISHYVIQSELISKSDAVESLTCGCNSLISNTHTQSVKKGH